MMNTATARHLRAAAVAAAVAALALSGCAQTPALDPSAQSRLSLRLRDGLEALPMPSRRVAGDEAWAALAPAFSAVLRRQARADGGALDGLRRALFKGGPRAGRPVFESGEALPRIPLRLANGPDKSGRLFSIPLRAADDPPGRPSADWAFVLGGRARLQLLRVPAGVLPATGGRTGADTDAAPRPEQHVVLLTDGGVCARDWRERSPLFGASREQPRGFLVHRDHCNGLFWGPVPPDGMAAGALGALVGGSAAAPAVRAPAPGDGRLAQLNTQSRYAGFVRVVGEETTELGVSPRDFAPAGWHFPTRAEAEDFAVLLLSAMPWLEVQPPGDAALPNRGFVVVTRPAELPGAGAPSAGSAR
ncbi:hypothetical protein GCM10009416_10070 [Craurococcus roseus]|uniref:Uncharacterized protein n=1 Tax=Craurococcus roseus TaxID=77585 RepID=A0ABN1ETS1_9PROT